MKLPALMKRSGPPKTVTSGSSNNNEIMEEVKLFISKMNSPTTDSFTCCPIGGVVDT